MFLLRTDKTKKNSDILLECRNSFSLFAVYLIIVQSYSFLLIWANVLGFISSA